MAGQRVSKPGRRKRSSVGRQTWACVLELRRRRSRVPWIYAVYHAPALQLDHDPTPGWLLPEPVSVRADEVLGG
jgi:hypothetical protein